ncbi:MAG TPA: tetratricopeptide repeat protein, partial [Nitrolancea sp.]|nr:tetratricopeptide repeat protein [Nitrolancea sp.]
TGGARDLPARQRTMRDAISWSYDLLDAEERRLFARLALFAGGGTLEAIEAICAQDAHEADAVLERAMALLNNNLLARDMADDHEDGAGERGPRLRMLEPIRQYAAERLAESDDREALRRRHAEYFLSFTEGARSEQAIWLRRIEREHDNLRAALGWAFERADDTARLTTGLRLASALWWFWEVRGYLAEGRAWLERGLSAGADVPAELRAAACYGLGALAIRQRDYAAADAFYGESLALSRALGDGTGVARALTTLGEVALRRGELARARGLLTESLALKHGLGDAPGVADALNIAGLVARDAGDDGEARALFEESLALMRELEQRWGVLIVLGNLGHLTLRQGDDARAAALLYESLGLAQELGAKWSIAYCLEGLAAAAAGRGAIERAARLWGAAEALRAAIDAPVPPNLAPHYEAQVAAARLRADERAWEAAWAAGRALPLEDAVSEALEAV